MTWKGSKRNWGKIFQISEKKISYTELHRGPQRTLYGEILKYRIASTRLQKWDYGWNAAYFVTICTHNREWYFGKIESGIMIYSELGSIAHNLWTKIPEHFPFVELSEFVVMPDHIHGIIIINKPHKHGNPVETQNFASLHPGLSKNRFGPQSENLGSIIRGYKIGVVKYAHEIKSGFKW